MSISSSKKDLEIAEKCIETMRTTKSYEEFRENWEYFLMRIERAWESAVRILKNKDGFQQWYKPYSELRKRDSLLVFLKQARHAEMHKVSTTTKKPLKMAVREKTGRSFRLDSISYKMEKGTLSIDLKSPDILLNLDAELLPTDPEVTRFKNRGKWYNPPWQHLKERIKNMHPVALAELGLSFYKSFISEGEVWLNGN